VAGPTREQVWSAVFALLNRKVAGVQSFSRKPTQPPDFATAVPPIVQPALFLREMDEKAEQKAGRGAPPNRVWHAVIIVYAQLPDRATVGASVFNPILDSIEAALAPSRTDSNVGAQTLGGLVSHCWIEGDVIKETGDLAPDGQGVIAVPIHVLIP
jgi:hypothetical protein